VVATARKRATNPTALVAQGWRHVDAGDLNAAYDTFDHATKSAPFDGAAWFGLGYAAEARGDIPGATRHYCKALDRAAGEVDLVREIQGRLRDLSRGCR
jgi:Flp pilus assembly protein TadD